MNDQNNAEKEWMELLKTALWAVILAVTIRAVAYEPFHIPSGSMKPTLLVGDYLFVSKFSYGYSRYSFPMGLDFFEGRIWADEPVRGDVIVFKLPSDNRTDYIKRIIGLPGDTVQVRSGRLYINGTLVHREFIGKESVTDRYGSTHTTNKYVETLPNGQTHFIYEESDNKPLDNTAVYSVPEGHYFAMGDNRDNSQDSRVGHLVGSIPFENIVGEAQILFFSTNGEARIWEFWKWPVTVRYDRLFNFID
jgi:signal peptidase I